MRNYAFILLALLLALAACGNPPPPTPADIDGTWVDDDITISSCLGTTPASAKFELEQQANELTGLLTITADGGVQESNFEGEVDDDGNITGTGVYDQEVETGYVDVSLETDDGKLVGTVTDGRELDCDGEMTRTSFPVQFVPAE